MSVLLALLLGLGVMLVYDGWTRSTPAGAWGARRFAARVSAMLADAELGTVSPHQLGLAIAGCALASAAVVALLVGSATVALVAGAAGAWAPLTALRSRAHARRRARARCWPEAIELLAGAVRAGDTLPAAVGLVAERGPEPLRPAFAAVVADHRVSGDFAGALERMAGALADPTADRVVMTLEVAHRVGGRELGRVLRTLAAFLREDLAVRQEIEARQSWTVVAARVAAGAPWLVLLLVASRPQAARAYDSLAGVVVLVGGALATVVGYRLMVTVARLPEEPRVLGRTAGAVADPAR